MWPLPSLAVLAVGGAPMALADVILYPLTKGRQLPDVLPGREPASSEAGQVAPPDAPDAAEPGGAPSEPQGGQAGE